MNATHPKVDAYLNRTKDWREEVEQLRAIALASGLTEELKWGHPCYSLEGSNVVLIHTFKAYCAFLFFKGALMKDPKDLLIQQTKNVQAARQIRFTKDTDIPKMKADLKAYIQQAIVVQKAGLEVEYKDTSAFEMPGEFQSALKKNAALKKAFEALTPGRQRAYLLHFSSAKQSKTRESRIEKCAPRILKGKGLQDE